MHMGKRFVYPHNDMENLDRQLTRAEKWVENTGGGILVITEGVFGMSGNMGDLKGVVGLKSKHNFRLLVDDAHGFGTMGATGAGAGEEQGVQDEIDVYFSTFAKSMASIGAFIATTAKMTNSLKYNLRSQIFAKTLPMPLVIGNLKRLELLKSKPELRENLWKIANAMQDGLRKRGFNIGTTNSPVTPVFLSGSDGTVHELTSVMKDLRLNFGVFCSGVTYPVVPKGVMMLRIIPTAAHSLEDVEFTLNAFDEIKIKLDAGAYSSEETLTQV